MSVGHTYRSILCWHLIIRESAQRSLKDSLGEPVNLEDKLLDSRDKLCIMILSTLPYILLLILGNRTCIFLNLGDDFHQRIYYYYTYFLFLIPHKIVIARSPTVFVLHSLVIQNELILILNMFNSQGIQMRFSPKLTSTQIPEVFFNCHSFKQ